MNNKKIIVYTRAYNTKIYIKKCIESVLSQTYRNFEYILVDNGSTDGSGEIMCEYAQKDPRIHLVRFEENTLGFNKLELIDSVVSGGDYLANLDSDDWWDQDYLEKLLVFAENNDLDMACTGCLFHYEKQTAARESKIKLIMDKSQYADYYPYYHQFLRTTWGKLINMDAVRKGELFIKNCTIEGLGYGGDTLSCFAYLRYCRRMGVDNTKLYHYRVHRKSVSHQYDPCQSYSDLYLYNDAVNFLEPYGPISKDNMQFMHEVYFHAVMDTVNNIVSSDLTVEEKFREYAEILSRDVTRSAFRLSDADIVNKKRMFLLKILESAGSLKTENDDFRRICNVLLPNCADVLTVSTVGLFTDERLFPALFEDDAEKIVEILLEYISHSMYSKKYDLTEILCILAKDNLLLANIHDKMFLRKYGAVYMAIYRKRLGDALDIATNILLKERLSNETFLQIYLSLAAILERSDEFIFGKVKSARFYANHKQFEKCREALTDLNEMGVEDNDEIIEIKKMLTS